MESVADLVLILLGSLLSVWGASLLLRILALAAARLRAYPPFKWMFRGRSAWDPRPEDVGTWRRVAVLLLGMAAVAAGGFCFMYRGRINPDREASVADLATGAVGGILIAFAVGAVIQGWLADPSRGRRRCPKCWYDFAGITGFTCPECGHIAATEASLRRTRRSTGMMRLSCVLLVLGLIVPLWPAFQRQGLLGITPTWVLIAFWEKLPAAYISRATAFGNGATQTVIESEGPLALRMNSRATLGEREWLASRLVSGVMAAKTLDEFAATRLLAMNEFGQLWRESTLNPRSELSITLDQRQSQLVLAALGSDFKSQSSSAKLRTLSSLMTLLQYNWLVGQESVWSSKELWKAIRDAASDPDPAVAKAGRTAMAMVALVDRSRAGETLGVLAAAGVPTLAERGTLIQVCLSVAMSQDSEREWLNLVKDPAASLRSLILWEVGARMNKPTESVVSAVAALESDPDLSVARAASLVRGLWSDRGPAPPDAPDQRYQLARPLDSAAWCERLRALAQTINDSGPQSGPDGRTELVNAARNTGCRNANLDRLVHVMLVSANPADQLEAVSYVSQLAGTDSQFLPALQVIVKTPGSAAQQWADWAIARMKQSLEQDARDRALDTKPVAGEDAELGRPDDK